MKNKIKKEIQIYRDTISDINAFNLTNKDHFMQLKKYSIALTKEKIKALKLALSSQ